MTRRSSTALTPAALAVVLSLATAATARASTYDPKRTLAVLEYRAGSAALPAIHERIAALLSRSTSLRVTDSSEARKLMGGVDQRVARCAGAARCVAAIGKKLGVDEVLLVGVSEFGDVILTLQRIDVRRRRVLSRVAEALGAKETPTDKILRRYLERVLPKSDFRRFGQIRIDTNVRGAKVVVGKTSRGSTPVKPLLVPAPGTYDISLTKRGYVPFHATIDVPPDAIVQVRPTMSRRSPHAWYKRWWAASIAGTLVVGAITTAVILSRDAPTDVGVTIPPFQ